MVAYCAGMMLACILIALLGRNRKFGFWGYLFASMLMSPFIGFLLVVASDPVKKNQAKPS